MRKIQREKPSKSLRRSESKDLENEKETTEGDEKKGMKRKGEVEMKQRHIRLYVHVGGGTYASRWDLQRRGSLLVTEPGSGNGGEGERRYLEIYREKKRRARENKRGVKGGREKVV